MNYHKKTSCFHSLLILFTFLIYPIEIEAQSYSSHGVELIPIEHASLVLKSEDLKIAIDPTATHQEFDQNLDLILITDIHGDHFSPGILEKISGSNTIVIAPQAVYDKMSASLKEKTTVLSNGEQYHYQSSRIEAIPMYNLREEALNFHSKGRGNGYLINMSDQHIYISGDTEDIPEMRALKNIDIALICMNLPYTMTESSAASAVLEFKPKKVIPYHFRGRPKVSDIDLFESLITDSSIEVVRLDWYPTEDY